MASLARHQRGWTFAISAVHPLASYLTTRVPEGREHSAAAQLCLRLYCTVDGVPKELLPLTKETLSEAFSQLGRSGWVRGGDDELKTPGHWLAIIRDIFKKGADEVDLERWEKLACQVGFVREKGVS